MKKITLFFATLMVAFTVSAQWGHVTIGQAGNYNLVSGEWINAEPAANQPFTFAILVTNADAQAWLASAPGRTLALGQARVGNESNATDIRLIPVENVANLYAIDISIAQVFGAVSVGGTTLHFNLTGASLTDGTWTWDAYAYGGINYAAASPAFNDAMQLTGTGDITNPVGTAMPGTINGDDGGDDLDLTAFNAILAEVAGLNEADYRPATWAYLQVAVEQAITASEVATTQDQIDGLVQGIRTAINALEPVDPVGLSSAFGEKGEPVSIEYYSVLGTKLPNTAKGLVVAKYTFADGSTRTEKLMK